MKSIFNKSNFSKRLGLLSLLVLLLFIMSCSKFLDKKSNKKLVVPATLQDAQALLDFYSLMNGFYPQTGMLSDDDYYLTTETWTTLPLTEHNNYIWLKENYNENEWRYMYQVVLQANLALETLNNIQPTSSEATLWNSIRGAALFYRAYAFYHVAQYYTVPYNKATADGDPGIPLRLSTDINNISYRSTVEETYGQISGDLKEAASLLPQINSAPSRPSKAAAFGALARTYLIMQDYQQAQLYSDSALLIKNTLMDYNTLDSTSFYPFSQFNEEVVFPSTILAGSFFTPANWRADTLLYNSYDSNDLRKILYYTNSNDSLHAFRGSYDGSYSPFNGIATDELYLIRAECKARLGDKNGALDDLNTLLITRYKTGQFTLLTATDASIALLIVLIERRKEMVARGSRWFDLRRLNTDSQTSKKLTRILDENVYELAPNDPRYTQYIPLTVINLTGIQQNRR